MSSKIIFNNKPLPDFLDLIKVNMPVLPPFEVVRGKRVYKDRPISLELAFNKQGLISESQEKQLIDWLITENEKAELIIYNNKNVFYYAQIANEINIQGFKRAKFTIEFISDPFKFSRRIYVQDITDDNEINYLGDIPTYPNLTFKVTNACSEIVLNFKNGVNEKPKYIKLHGEFNSKDIITIDQEHNKVLINGELRMGIWSLDSKRHKLEKGNNFYTLERGNCQVEVNYKALYL